MRGTVGLRELTDQVLHEFGLVGHDSSELTCVLGVVDVESGGDEVGVRIVLREHDRLPEAVSPGHPATFGHQDLEYFVDGVGVEQPFVYGGRVDFVGDEAVVPVEQVPLVAFVRGQIRVADAAGHEPERNRSGDGRHQVTVGNGLPELIGARGHAVFEVEEAVGVVVDLVLRRRGQPHEQGVEVGEDFAVFLVNRPVGLIDDDEVEIAGAEPPQPAL